MRCTVNPHLFLCCLQTLCEQRTRRSNFDENCDACAAFSAVGPQLGVFAAMHRDAAHCPLPLVSPNGCSSWAGCTMSSSHWTLVVSMKFQSKVSPGHQIVNAYCAVLLLTTDQHQTLIGASTKPLFGDLATDKDCSATVWSLDEAGPTLDATPSDDDRGPFVGPRSLGLVEYWSRGGP